ncbi:glycosyltransferase [Rhodobacteraceae bacterium RKSG542]|uniref:glycosyltransferase family 2 protein n=1 Tax=Pseudovibrio flavus TaxID=2529854 RepID=UPI0012BB87D9|nr:glycosyltransferase [Pseudovibrio flavus]MTI18565.1 glycosyltransferase [Pseudovibrio flavus]
MPKKPLISVVLPVFNGENYIEAALTSIMNQDFKDIEILVINDGSVDQTGAILERLAGLDKRIRVLTKGNGGLVSALNWGLAEAKADVIARMDADDISYPSRLSKQWQVLKERPEIGLVFSQMNKIDTRGRSIGEITNTKLSAEDVAEALSKGDCLPHHPTVMARKMDMLDVGGYREAFKGAEDLDLWYRMSKRTKLIGLSEILLDYRLHDGQVTQVSVVRQRFSRDLVALIAKEVDAGRRDPSEGWIDAPDYAWTVDTPQLCDAPADMLMLFSLYKLIDQILTDKNISDLSTEDISFVLKGLNEKPFFCSAKLRQVLAHHLVQEAKQRGLRILRMNAMLFALKNNPSRALRKKFKPF